MAKNVMNFRSYPYLRSLSYLCVCVFVIISVEEMSTNANAKDIRTAATFTFCSFLKVFLPQEKKKSERCGKIFQNDEMSIWTGKVWEVNNSKEKDKSNPKPKNEMKVQGEKKVCEPKMEEKGYGWVTHFVFSFSQQNCRELSAIDYWDLMFQSTLLSFSPSSFPLFSLPFLSVLELKLCRVGLDPV